MSSSALVHGARGGGLTLIGQAARVILQFLSVVVLSRLLSPDDFGLIAMVTIFVSLGELLRDFGVSTAALQAASLTRQQASNLFWANTALGALAGCLLLVTSPLLVAAYDEPRLAEIVPAMTAILFTNGIQAQVQVQLARSLRFRALVVTDLLSQALGLGFAVMAALLGMGYWALVVQTATVALCLLVSRAIAASWLPALPRRGSETMPLILDGGRLGITQFLSFGASNIDTFVIGARWGAEPLGFYNRAFQLLTVPAQRLLTPLTQVVLPTLNRHSEDIPERMSILLRAQFVLGSAIAVLFAIAAGVAPALLPMLLGEQWTPSVLLFQLLAAGGAVGGLSYVSYWIFLSGRLNKSLLRYNIVTKSSMIAIIAASAQLGVWQVAAAYSACTILSWPVGLFWLARTLDRSMLPFLGGGLRILTASTLAFLASAATVSISAPEIACVALGLVAGAAAFLIAILAFPAGRQSMKDMFPLIKAVFGCQS